MLLTIISYIAFNDYFNVLIGRINIFVQNQYCCICISKRNSGSSDFSRVLSVWPDLTNEFGTKCSELKLLIKIENSYTFNSISKYEQTLEFLTKVMQ